MSASTIPSVHSVTDTRLKEEEEERLFGWIRELAREVKFARAIRAEESDLAKIVPLWEKQQQLMLEMAQAKSKDTKEVKVAKVAKKIERLKLER